jgi:predicted DNA-binding transcriptional regulator YafY
MTDLDRLYRYKSLLTSRHALSSQALMTAMGVSLATLKRDLAVLRDRLNIPVVYDRQLGGYTLPEGHRLKELPGLWLSASELTALATLQHLLTSVAPGVLADKLAPLKTRLAALLHDVDLDSVRLSQRIRWVHAGQRRLPPQAFQAVAEATLGRVRLHLVHHNRSTNQTVSRTVSPQQLVHYRDNWYLDAWCHLREDLRSFSVDALSEARVLADQPALDMDAEVLRTATQGSYGIFSGAPTGWAVLCFSAERARWVCRETWHPEQTHEWLPDGRYRLRLPYSDARELLGDVLRQGPHCVVEAPESLRQQVMLQLAETARGYGKPPVRR